jgi:hypothetical protein
MRTFRAVHGGECGCSLCHQATIDTAEVASVGRYRAMWAMAEAAADADRRARAMERLERSLDLGRCRSIPRVGAFS